MIFFARSRNDNRIFPMTVETLGRALQECGSPNPAQDLESLAQGVRVRRGRWSFWKVDPALDVPEKQD